MATWVTDDADGAFQSDLKLTLGGYRTYTTAYVSSSGTYGMYWSSTVDGTEVLNLFFCCSGGGAVNTLSSIERARGMSVRCIKD